MVPWCHLCSAAYAYNLIYNALLCLSNYYRIVFLKSIVISEVCYYYSEAKYIAPIVHDRVFK